MKIDPAWLEDGKDMAVCPVCYKVLHQPTVGCPEGHALCRECYVTELSHRKKCPLCQHPTDVSKLLRCRPLEDLIGHLQMHCKYEGDGGEADTNLELMQCTWRGRVCEFAAHLAESCAYETVSCPNAAAGCKESVVRKDAAHHASETCEYRQCCCAHCNALVIVRHLPVHELSCPGGADRMPERWVRRDGREAQHGGAPRGVRARGGGMSVSWVR